MLKERNELIVNAKEDNVNNTKKLTHMLVFYWLSKESY